MDVKVISKTQQEFKGETYYLCGFYFQRNGVRLHREVYKHHCGEIPEGYHVHHVDGNRSNNDISNLELREACEHSADHANRPEHIAYGRMHIERIRPLASKWHGSEEGKAWHRKHGEETFRARTESAHVCSLCGKSFKTKRLYGANENKFCSNACKAEFRRRSGVDDEERICACCGKTFSINKYAKTMTCSRTCAQKLRFSNENQGYSLCGQG